MLEVLPVRVPVEEEKLEVLPGRLLVEEDRQEVLLANIRMK